MCHVFTVLWSQNLPTDHALIMWKKILHCIRRAVVYQYDMLHAHPHRSAHSDLSSHSLLVLTGQGDEKMDRLAEMKKHQESLIV